MKYWQPLGISDPDAHYINGNPEIGQMGSIPPAEGFEHTMREMLAIIDYSEIVRDAEDLEQAAKAVRSQRMNYCEDTGSIDTLSVALDPPLTNYSLGLPLHVKVRETNTGPATIDAGAGRVPIRKPSGAELAAGDLPSNALAGLIYDGTVFQLINFGGAAGEGGGGDTETFLINIPYTVDTGTPNTVVANFSAGAGITTYSAGLIFMVKIANTNNTFANINVNGLGLRPVYAMGGHPNWPLLPGDLMAGDVLIFVYDGSAFWIYPNTGINQNVTFNVSTVTQINELFAAMSRKRISTSGSVIIKMAIGIYGPLTGTSDSTIMTYHADAERITLEGTLIGPMRVPTAGDFLRSGSSPANRANDSVYNINLMRSMYGSEVRWNTTQQGAIAHRGPGMINYKNILCAGPNVPSGQSNGIQPASGSSIAAYGCTVWGSNTNGFGCSSGFLYCGSCHAANNHSNGFVCGYRGSISMGGGSAPGNAGNGLLATTNSMIIATTDSGLAGGNTFQSACNGSAGAYVQIGSTIQIHYGVIIVNASIDAVATDQSVIALLNGTTYSTISPAANTEGNLNSLARVY